MLIRWPWENPPSTLVHVTHHKAGSEWVRAVLEKLFGRYMEPRLGNENFVNGSEGEKKWRREAEIFKDRPFHEGRIYPGVCLTRDEFVERTDFAKVPRFIVIRDPRDSLVSHYFSMRNTHKPDKHGFILAQREKLQSLSTEDGLMYLFETLTPRTAAIHRSWWREDEVVVRYEDLITDDVGQFEDLFLRRLQLPISRKKLVKAVEACRFEKVFKRKLGDVDEKSHGRQGLPSAWKKHFSDELTTRFHETYGDLLKMEGYLD